MAEHMVDSSASPEESPTPDSRDEESREHLKPMEELETIILSEECPTRVVKIGTKLIAKVWEELIIFLKAHTLVCDE